MKRTALILASIALSAAGAARADLQGGWTAGGTRATTEPGWIHLELSHDDSNLGHTVRFAELAGLTAAQVAAQASTPVYFTLRREAGTLKFEGSFRNGHGGGD